MILRITGAHYNYEVTVNGNVALLELANGWWVVTDTKGNLITPYFRAKEHMTAVARVVRLLKAKPCVS